MKELFDIHVVLSTSEDFEQYDEQAEEASELFNEMLHHLYAAIDDDKPVGEIEQLFQHVWEHWTNEPQLIDIDTDELFDWVDQLLATWEDGDSTDMSNEM